MFTSIKMGVNSRGANRTFISDQRLIARKYQLLDTNQNKTVE